MKLQMFSIYDAAAGTYLRPFFAQSRGEAVREFSDIANDDAHPIGKHPDDYTLMVVGAFDTEDGHVDSIVPVSLGNALEFRAKARVMKLEGTNDG